VGRFNEPFGTHDDICIEYTGSLFFSELEYIFVVVYLCHVCTYEHAISSTLTILLCSLVMFSIVLVFFFLFLKRTLSCLSSTFTCASVIYQVRGCG
jgi:hypothetical protein